MYQVETSRLDFIRDRKTDPDTVLLNKDWPILPKMLFFPGRGPKFCTCRHHCEEKKWKRLYPHPPRKPHGNNLSSCRADQLSHAVLQPRIAKPIVRKGHCTTPCLGIHTCSYAGSDCATVTTESRFENNGPRPMSFLHESTSIGRPDILQLADHLLADRQISHEMLDDWKRMYSQMESNGELKGLTRGATFTPTINAIRLQIASSLNDKVLVTVKQALRGGRVRDIIIPMTRSWCPAIGNMQVEDDRGYGWPIKAINLNLRSGSVPRC